MSHSPRQLVPLCRFRSKALTLHPLVEGMEKNLSGVMEEFEKDGLEEKLKGVMEEKKDLKE